MASDIEMFWTNLLSFSQMYISDIVSEETRDLKATMNI